jgi:Icc-related predicted phosphoesterase
LDRNGVYYYQLFLAPEGRNQKRFGTYRFKTPKSSGKEFKFVIMGDQHLYDDNVSRFPENYYFVNDVYQALKSGRSSKKYIGLRSYYVAHAILLAQQEDPDFIIFLGDESGTGSVKYRYMRMGLKVGDYKLNSRILTNRWMGANREYFHSIPTFFVYGNHDLQDWLYPDQVEYIIEDMQSNFPQYIDRKVNGVTSGFTYREKSALTEKWGAFRWGNVLFVLMYSHGSVNNLVPLKPEDRKIGEMQYKYVERKLRNSRAPFKFLISHNTFTGGPYKSNCREPGAYGRGGKNYSDVGEENRIHNLMKKFGPGINRIYGHDHALAIGDDGNGNRYLCGGSPSYPGQWLGRPGWNKMYKGDYWNGHRGILVGHVKGESMTFEYKSCDPLEDNYYKTSRGEIPSVEFGGTVKKFKINPS